jgi:hypothetical protein
MSADESIKLGAAVSSMLIYHFQMEAPLKVSPCITGTRTGCGHLDITYHQGSMTDSGRPVTIH